MKRIAIFGGPSFISLCAAMADGTAAEFQARREEDTSTVTFHLILNSIGRESGDGKQWILKGYIYDSPTALNTRTFEAYYRTDTKVGHFFVK